MADPIDSFRKAVQDVATTPVIFINPNAFKTNDYQLNKPLLDQQIEAQRAGLSAKLTDDEKKNITERAFSSRAPSFIGKISDDSNSVGIVIEPKKEFNSKAAIGEMFSGIRASRLNLPGVDADYVAFTGAHEGGHVDQDFTHANEAIQKAAKTSGIASIDANTQMNAEILKLEGGADNGALKWAKDKGKTEVSDVVMDLRSLSLMSGENDPEHATRPVADGRLQANGNTIQAAQLLQNQVAGAAYRCIAKDTGIQENEVIDLRKDNPELFYGVTKAMLDKGAFDTAPQEKIFAQDYVGAYERRVNPAPDAATAKPVSTRAENEFCANTTIPKIPDSMKPGN